MESLRNLTYQEQSILKAIHITTIATLNEVALIYKVTKSFDETIVVINESLHIGESIDIALEISKEISTIINKIEE